MSQSSAAAIRLPIQQRLAPLREGNERLGRFVGDLFSELEVLRQRLAEADNQLREERRHLADERRRAEREREQAREQVSQFDDERQRLEDESQRLADLRHRLDRDKRELEAERRAFADEQRHATPHTGEPDPALAARLQEAEQDRQALELELENIRGRAVELSQELAEQKRQMAEERAEWTAELRQLRRILDKQAAWLSQQADPATPGFTGAAAGGGHPAVPVHTGAIPHGAPRSDPVLGSVLSQFELLQKEIARRRGTAEVKSKVS